VSFSIFAASAPSAVPAPSTPLGPFADSALSWTTWVTLMGFVGLVALALSATGPVAARLDPPATARTTTRLVVPAAVLGVLVVPAVLASLGYGPDGYDWSGAWGTLFDGTAAGRLSGLEVVFALVGALLVAPLAWPSVAGGRARIPLLVGGLVAGSIALGTTKFPTALPAAWGQTVFSTVVWMLHLFGGAVWIGGLAGLLLLALPGAVPAARRRAFWSPVIRRFSIAAMTSVGAITLSGLYLYWQHVDGPAQLVTTMYGRVLGVKILIFGALLLLGMFNQFWLHPRIDALRAAGDERPLRTLLLRQFPAVVAIELLLGLSVLFVAPFLHGSARNQAFQEQAAAVATSADKPLPKIAAKHATASTWVWGTVETAGVVAIMIVGYRVSGRIARKRQVAAGHSDRRPDEVVPA
jgi:putative copper export protein